MIGRTRKQKWWLWNTSHLWCLHAVTRDEPCLFLFASFSVLPFHAEETVALWDGQVPLVNALGCIRQSAYKARCIKTNYKYMERCLPEMHKTKFIWQGALKEAKIELGGKLAISRVVQRSLFNRSKKMEATSVLFFSGRSTMPTKWWSVWNMQQKLISGKSIFIIGQKIFFFLLTKVSLPCTKLWGFAENDSLNKTGNWLICISS